VTERTPARTATARDRRAPAVIPSRLDATVVLVRHGESTWVAEGRVQGDANPPLSALGHRQAALVAARIADPLASPPLPVPAGQPIGCWHSPLDRAASTARAISIACGPALEMRADERLREIGQGEWQGLTGAEVRARFGDVRAGWRRDPVHVHAPGGESLPAVGRRAVSFADELLARLAEAGPPADGRPSNGRSTAHPAVPWAIVVAHEGLLRVLLISLLGLPLDAFWRFPLGLCGLSVVDVRDGRPSLRAHNLLDHLAPLGTDAAARAAADRGGGL
jgi:broad specificity phosphatase PhoE